MAQFIHRGNTATTNGELPSPGQIAPDFVLTKLDLSDTTLSDYKGMRVVLNIFPSIDTATCATSVRQFNKRAASLPNTKVLCISKDLPFAQKRFCGAEGIDQVECLSQYKNNTFSDNYHISIASGSAMVGLFARAVVVIDEKGVVLHTELVADISQEPNYDAVEAALA